MNYSKVSAVESLSLWAATLSEEDVPDSVRQLAKASFADTVGVAIAGSKTSVAWMARGLATERACTGVSAVWGSRLLLSAQSAAFVNGTSAHALDFDDNCYAGFVHGSAVVAPAALAVAQKVDASGRELITAFVAGSEVEYAFGAALGNALYDEGWWTTAVLGPIGASVAASHLLKLSPEKMSHAVGLAIAGTGGMKSCFGTDAKALMVGRAAEAGVFCALMADRGATSPKDVVEARNGFVRLFNSEQFDGEVFGRLGSSWFLNSPGVDVKRIPVCLSSHAAVDAVMGLVLENGIQDGDIESVFCDVPPIVCANLIYDNPITPQEAQFSMQFAIAASLRYGSISLEHLQSWVLDGDVFQKSMERVHMRSGPMWCDERLKARAPEGAEVTMLLRDGRRFSAFCAYPRGASGNPMTSLELDEKFLSCSVPSLGEAEAKRLLMRLRTLDSLEPVRQIFETTCGG